MLMPAVTAFPYGKDPTGSHIRIAPSFPSLQEITQAARRIALALLVALSE
jgi:DNA-binding transcriptional MocR family regulator